MSTLYLEEEVKVEMPFNKEELAKTAVNKVVEWVKCPYEVEVNLLLTSNREIKEINEMQRGIEKETDVLSFPMIEFQTPGDFSKIEEEPACIHPQSKELMLGDIVLSMEKVIEQAEEFQHSLEREYTFLIVHSMLHLFGYDHMEEDEKNSMEEAQKNIMHQLKIYR